MHAIRHGTTAAAITLALAVQFSHATPIWFDATAGGRGYSSFHELAAAYHDFIDEPSSVITFNDLREGVVLGNQYADTHGVRFLNTALGRYAAYSGVRPEHGSIVEELTGYDGSYMPSGDLVLVKFDNHLAATPLTILFDRPVSMVGGFVGMGVEGSIHSLTISIYNESNQLIDCRVVESWLWESSSKRQNYESFFAFRGEDALISRVEILNNSSTDFANALVLDNLAFGRAVVPEPAVAALVAVVAATWFRRRRTRVASR